MGRIRNNKRNIAPNVRGRQSNQSLQLRSKTSLHTKLEEKRNIQENRVGNKIFSHTNEKAEYKLRRSRKRSISTIEHGGMQRTDDYAPKILVVSTGKNDTEFTENKITEAKQKERKHRHADRRASERRRSKEHSEDRKALVEGDSHKRRRRSRQPVGRRSRSGSESTVVMGTEYHGSQDPRKRRSTFHRKSLYELHDGAMHIYDDKMKNERLKELRDMHAPYKVILIPGDNPGVRWLTTFGLLGATILFFALWGSVLFYILTPEVKNGTVT